MQNAPADSTKGTAMPSQYDEGMEAVYPANPSEASREPRRGQTGDTKIFGLRVTTFVLSALLSVVAIVGGVGGGVAGSLAVRNARNENSATAVTVTATTTVTTTTISRASTASSSGTSTASGLVVPTGVLALDCPNLSNEGNLAVTVNSQTWYFSPECEINVTGDDILSIIVYSLHDCMQACATMNSLATKDECVGITFWANMTLVLPWIGGNCWLKNGTGNQLGGQGDLTLWAPIARSPYR